MTTKQIVHIIDDDPAIRDAVSLLLSTEGYDARSYASALVFLGDVDPATSGCIVTDVRMPGVNGLELIATLAERDIDLPIIVITGHADVPLAVHAMKQGAVDLLEKPFRSADLLSCVEQALARKAADGADAGGQDAAARLATLSARENEVLSGLLKGLQNKVIAHEMGISARTVEVHRANVMKKTHASSLSELVRLALTAQRR